MKPFDRTIRWLVVACMAISFSISALSPSLLPLAEASVDRRADRAEVCCCGVESGQCCGLACCVTKSPNQPEKPARDRADNQSNSRFELATWDRAGGDAGTASRFCSLADHSPTAKHPAENSLQALLVRLDT